VTKTVQVWRRHDAADSRVRLVIDDKDDLPERVVVITADEARELMADLRDALHVPVSS